MAKQLPKTEAERLEYISSTLAKRMFERRKEFLTTVATRPYKAEKATPQEMRMRMAEIRKDPAAFATMIQKVGRVKEDGRVLLPKDLIEPIMKLERELKVGVINFDMPTEEE